MQGLADGYFVLRTPSPIIWWAPQKPAARPKTAAAEFQQAEDNVRGITARLLAVRARSRSATSTSGSARSSGTAAGWPATPPT